MESKDFKKEVVLDDEKNFLGYHILAGDLSLPFKDGYNDDSAIKRAQNLAGTHPGIILIKGFRIEGKVQTKRLYPVANKDAKVFKKNGLVPAYA